MAKGEESRAGTGDRNPTKFKSAIKTKTARNSTTLTANFEAKKKFFESYMIKGGKTDQITGYFPGIMTSPGWDKSVHFVGT